jgi:hypothetical protein
VAGDGRVAAGDPEARHRRIAALAKARHALHARAVDRSRRRNRSVGGDGPELEPPGEGHLVQDGDLDLRVTEVGPRPIARRRAVDADRVRGQRERRRVMTSAPDIRRHRFNPGAARDPRDLGVGMKTPRTAGGVNAPQPTPQAP